jgi:hypothetical protein
VAANDVWAVGSYNDGTINQTLIVHWDGTGWSIVPSPNVNTGSNYLNGVTALAPDNIWAVGWASDLAGSLSQTLILHWNGTSWAPISSPNPATFNSLQAVTAVGPVDIWATATFGNAGATSQTLTEHWNGTSWNVVPSPNSPTADNNLTGVSAVAGNDIWAVGSIQDTLTEHWNGSVWSLIPSPNVGSFQTGLHAVAAAAHADVWAVGEYFDATDTAQTLTEHWDGSSWTIVSSPSLGSDFLLAAVALSTRDVWALGRSDERTLALHWDGASWRIVPSQNGGGGFYGVTAVSARDLWAVGEGYGQTLIERYYCPGP